MLNTQEVLMLVIHILEYKNVIDFEERLRINDFIKDNPDVRFKTLLEEIMKSLD